MRSMHSLSRPKWPSSRCPSPRASAAPSPRTWTTSRTASMYAARALYAPWQPSVSAPSCPCVGKGGVREAAAYRPVAVAIEINCPADEALGPLGGVACMRAAVPHGGRPAQRQRPTVSAHAQRRDGLLIVRGRPNFPEPPIRPRPPPMAAATVFICALFCHHSLHVTLCTAFLARRSLCTSFLAHFFAHYGRQP